MSLKKTPIVQSFMHTEAIDTEYVVLKFLRTDGSVAQVRAYVVDRIINMAKEIRDEFKDTTPRPESRFSGEVEILLGLEELALHPSRIELRGNLGVFVSPLSNTAILGGRHDKIFLEPSYLSQA